MANNQVEFNGRTWSVYSAIIAENGLLFITAYQKSQGRKLDCEYVDALRKCGIENIPEEFAIYNQGIMNPFWPNREAEPEKGKDNK